MPQTKYLAGHNIFRSIGLLVVILLVGLAYYFFAGAAQADRPPSLSIGGNRFQGLIGDDIGCRLNGLREFTVEDVADYRAPSGVPASQHYTLKRGVHLYHVAQDTTIAEILNYIVPTENNKILIAFYNYGLGGTDAGFYLDPEMAENFPIEDADAFTIPAYHGFVLISCQEGEILKIKDEKLAGTGLPDNLDTVDGWILLAVPDNAALEASVTGLGPHLKSLWVQNGPGFNFEKVEDLNSPELSDDYYMVWFKLDSTAVADEEDDDSDDDSDDNDDSDDGGTVIERAIDVEVDIGDTTDEINTEKLDILDKDSTNLDDEDRGSPEAVSRDTGVFYPDTEGGFSFPIGDCNDCKGRCTPNSDGKTGTCFAEYPDGGAGLEDAASGFQRPDSCSDCDTTNIAGCRDCDGDGYYIQCLADSDPCGSSPSDGIDADDRNRNVH